MMVLHKITYRDSLIRNPKKTAGDSMPPTFPPFLRHPLPNQQPYNSPDTAIQQKNQRLVRFSWPFKPAMQSMPLLLRQSLRSTVTFTRTSRPVRSPLHSAVGPKPLPAGSRRQFSICVQCQFRSQFALYSSNETEKLKDGKTVEQPADKDQPATGSSERSSTIYLGAGSLEPPPSAKEGNETEEVQQQEVRDDAKFQGTESSGLPSYLENRRSQVSKQFTTMMDNLQSNIFVAGQRLNDLTGYSSIEALKKDIHTQGMKQISPCPSTGR